LNGALQALQGDISTSPSSYSGLIRGRISLVSALYQLTFTVRTEFHNLRDFHGVSAWLSPSMEMLDIRGPKAPKLSVAFFLIHCLRFQYA